MFIFSYQTVPAAVDEPRRFRGVGGRQVRVAGGVRGEEERERGGPQQELPGSVRHGGGKEGKGVRERDEADDGLDH